MTETQEQRAAGSKAPTPKIFISYAREDARDIAIRLRDDLIAAGHEAWLDLSEIAAGASWSWDIESAIESADMMLALMTTGSYVSDICRAEQQRALRKGKRVIPLMIQPDADRPLYLENLNYLDFTNPARYGESFRDLLGYIRTGEIPKRLTATPQQGAALPKLVVPHLPSAGAGHPGAQKRDARAFRRYLADLRDEPWLGARYWWPYFLFYFGDVHEIAAILNAGLMLPPAQAGSKARRSDRTTARWEHYVRLYFRPRTPDLFMQEGVRAGNQRANGHTPVPIYLLFDLEAVICLPETRFTEGDVTSLERTYKSASAFRDLPFDLIYHDSWFRPDEREEVMNARRSQVVLPGTLPLDHLRHIWCRSAAEYETLRTLLPEETWTRWRDKITSRTDYNLFNRRWLYVDEALLTADSARFRFSPCDGSANDCGTFSARAELTFSSGEKVEYRADGIDGDTDLIVTLQPGRGDYDVRLYLDDALAYAGQYHDEPDVF
ncbi:MAG: DarT ssDNA thymidine ADP-ribosyltransferase family protein [bacterium]|nr:DarT ssDNA thymidine ADP-ribosyltransferase family protein [bacterium]